jgi:hypothetical protein
MLSAKYYVMSGGGGQIAQIKEMINEYEIFVQTYKYRIFA